ncbi:uncharacterized protein LOC141622292 isoform X2 [Silene latifolia]|uniref:uncharacterized protein LOC141622292 isoform X2 n=1 Tax=Silene latifolia TaxID=37657 RepID=UPI003D782788
MQINTFHQNLNHSISSIDPLRFLAFIFIVRRIRLIRAFKQAEIKNIIYWAFDFAAVRIKNRRVKCQAESRSSSSSERILDLSPFTGAAVALVTAASE